MSGVVYEASGGLEVSLRAFLLESERRWRSPATKPRGRSIFFYSIEVIY